MDKLIHKFNNFSLYRLSIENLFEASEFIIKTNYEHHQNYFPVTINDEIESLYIKEQEKFENSFFYVIRNNEGKIAGTIRVLKWDKKITLPIFSIFNVNIERIIEKGCNTEDIWHIGCLAINAKILAGGSIIALKSLLVQAIYHVCSNNSIMLAECDRKLFDKVKLLGIYLTEIGESQHYIGSEVVPAYNISINLMNFLWKQRLHLYIDEISSIFRTKNKKESDNTEYSLVEPAWAV